MLKRRLCEATFEWQLECKGPLLIRDERYARYKGKKEEGFPDCLFISHCSEEEIKEVAKRCGNNPPEIPFYVPGTSIRGPFRAQGERIIRSLLPADVETPKTACDPFEQDKEHHRQTLGCSTRLEKLEENISKYAVACPACKLFGYAGLASRIQFHDAEISQCNSVYRDMIGIDRFTGGVYTGGAEGGGANMRFHVLENTKFSTTVNVVNFELWHLGLLAYLFRDFEEGRVPLGFGKTKGFGQVTGEITEITLTYPTSPTRLEHLGSLMEIETERNYYGIYSTEAPAFESLEPLDTGLTLYKSFKVTDIPAFWATAAPAFNHYIEELNRPVEEERS